MSNILCFLIRWEKVITHCQSVPNKLQVFNLPSELQDIRKIEKVFIIESLLFKRVIVTLHGQIAKITRTICNVPIDTV